MYQFRLTSFVLGGFLLLTGIGCANRPPVLNCLPEMTTLTEGQSTTIQSNATDPDRRDQLTFAWQADRGNLTPQNDRAVFNSTGLAPGTYMVNLEVRDRKQNAATCQVPLTVQKNMQAPTIACEPSSAQVTEGQSTTLTARASDPNNDRLTYAWTVGGQSVTNNQPSFAFGTTGRSIGVHTVRVTATDVDNMSAGCNFNVTINRRPNTNPTVTLTLNPQTVYAGESVNASAQASDPEQDPITYAWSVDGQQRSGTAAQMTVNTTGMAGGQHSVSVTVRDDRDGTATATQSFSVRERVTILVNALRVDNVAKAQLDEIALKMRQNPQLRATLTGHTDDRGSEEANQRVGMRRAEAVQAYLVDEQGVAAGRLEARSAGETQPASDNSTEQGRRENRRVVVELF